MVPSDIMEHCRLCLVKESVSINIFENENEIRQLYFKIIACLPIRLSRQDQRLPKKICASCNLKVDELYQFWTQTANTEKTLERWISEADQAQAVTLTKIKCEFDADMPITKIEPRDHSSDDGDRGMDGFDDNYRDDSDVPDTDFEPNSMMHVTYEDVEPSGDIDRKPKKIIKKKSEYQNKSYKSKEPRVSDGYIVKKMDPIPCPLCVDSKELMTESKLRYHIRKDHPDTTEADLIRQDILQKRKVQCPYCAKVLSRRDKLNRHIRAIHGDKEKIEGSGGGGGSGRTYNPNSSRGEKVHEKVQCQYCAKFLSRKDKLTRHIQTVHFEGARKCDICHEEFSSKALYKQHIFTHKEKQKFECDCGYVSDKKHKLLEHVRRIHLKEFKVLCPICGYGCFYNAELKEHVAIVHNGERPECAICHQTFAKRRNLDLHNRRFHDTSNNTPCPHCGKGFASQGRLNEHLKQVHPPQKHQCHLCDKIVISAKSLKKHMIIMHTADKPFICKECGKAFKIKDYLTLHMRTHTGKYPTFVCKICNETISSEFRTKHMATHDVEKSHLCPYCSAAFLNDSGLKAHMRKHQDQYALQPLQTFSSLQMESLALSGVDVIDQKKYY